MKALYIALLQFFIHFGPYFALSFIGHDTCGCHLSMPVLKYFQHRFLGPCNQGFWAEYGGIGEYPVWGTYIVPQCRYLGNLLYSLGLWASKPKLERLW